jgi:hypothetical protein
MTNRFFKTAAIKSLHHGLSAWFIFEVINLFEEKVPDSSTLEILLKIILRQILTPGLAIFGSEALMNYLFKIKIDYDTAILNFVGATTSSVISASSNISEEFSIPMSLYSFAIYYHFFCREDEAPDNTPQTSYRIS